MYPIECDRIQVTKCDLFCVIFRCSLQMQKLFSVTKKNLLFLTAKPRQPFSTFLYVISYRFRCCSPCGEYSAFCFFNTCLCVPMATMKYGIVQEYTHTHTHTIANGMGYGSILHRIVNRNHRRLTSPIQHRIQRDDTLLREVDSVRTHCLGVNEHQQFMFASI